MPTSRGRHPIFARVYERLSVAMERSGTVEHRGEVGAGNGLNFAHYPEQVGAVVAVEPEPYLRQAAVRATENVAGIVELGRRGDDSVRMAAFSTTFEPALLKRVKELLVPRLHP